MSEKQDKLLAEFESKMRQLMLRCDDLKEQNDILREELKTKSASIVSLNQDIQELKKQHGNLVFAKAISSGSQEEVQNAKQRLSKLVRDVDKCIALLKV